MTFTSDSNFNLIKTHCKNTYTTLKVDGTVFLPVPSTAVFVPVQILIWKCSPKLPKKTSAPSTPHFFSGEIPRVKRLFAEAWRVNGAQTKHALHKQISTVSRSIKTNPERTFSWSRSQRNQTITCANLWIQWLPFRSHQGHMKETHLKRLPLAKIEE